MNWKRELRRLSYKYRHCIANDAWDLPNPNTLSEDDKIDERDCKNQKKNILINS